MKKIICLMVCTLIACLCLTACGNSEKSLYGTWEVDHDKSAYGIDTKQIVFNSDNTGDYDGKGFCWTLDNDMMTIYGNNGSTDTMIFNIDKKILTLLDPYSGNKIVLHKK